MVLQEKDIDLQENNMVLQEKDIDLQKIFVFYKLIHEVFILLLLSF